MGRKYRGTAKAKRRQTTREGRGIGSTDLGTTELTAHKMKACGRRDAELTPLGRLWGLGHFNRTIEQHGMDDPDGVMLRDAGYTVRDAYLKQFGRVDPKAINDEGPAGKQALDPLRAVLTDLRWADIEEALMGVSRRIYDDVVNLCVYHRAPQFSTGPDETFDAWRGRISIGLDAVLNRARSRDWRTIEGRVQNDAAVAA